MNAEILADSLNVDTGDRITTFLLPRFPKCLLAELNTHRMLSRNAASSRAIPIRKVVERTEEDPYIPVWTRIKKGMGGIDNFSEIQKEERTRTWLEARDRAIETALRLSALEVAKQEANRVLEPWMRVPVLVTATEWDNFFALRTDEAAQPDFRVVALEMKELMERAEPASLNPGEWHIPFRNETGRIRLIDDLRVATARAARISYTTHDGQIDFGRDIKLHDRLRESGHWSPFEHAAIAVRKSQEGRSNRFYNLYGFQSYRYALQENGGV